ncbi:hypothetical protein NIES2104_63790 [Leptolyngbya sp. NIES-2104]|nr:hypothetical protein NIES2104_63790 [Leptolyngbya sp. NIES-2104]
MPSILQPSDIHIQSRTMTLSTGSDQLLADVLFFGLNT